MRWSSVCHGHFEANLSFNPTSANQTVMDTTKVFKHSAELREYWRLEKRKQRKTATKTANASDTLMSHITGKIEILGIMDNEIYFEYHQAEDRKNLGCVLKFPLDEQAGWQMTSSKRNPAVHIKQPKSYKLNKTKIPQLSFTESGLGGPKNKSPKSLF